MSRKPTSEDHVRGETRSEKRLRRELPDCKRCTLVDTESARTLSCSSVTPGLLANRISYAFDHNLLQERDVAEATLGRRPRSCYVVRCPVKVLRPRSRTCSSPSSATEYIHPSLVEYNAERCTSTTMADVERQGQYSAVDGYSSDKSPSLSHGLVNCSVVISAEHVFQTPTTMHIEEEQNLMGLSNFSATLDNGVQLFTVRGRRHPFSKKREVLDSNGTPILALHARPRSFTCAWYAESSCHHRERVLEVDRHGALGSPFSLNVLLQNRGDDSTAGSGVCTLDHTTSAANTMQVVCRSDQKGTFEVYLLGSRVAHVKRIVPTAIRTGQPAKSHTWVTRVAATIDLSIVSLRSFSVFTNIIS